MKTKKKAKVVDEEVAIGPSSVSDKPRKKKKAPASDEAPRKKKKKKRDPEVAGSKLERRKAKLNEALQGLDMETIARNAKPGEREYLDEYVWMFNRIGRLIRATEKRALKSGHSRDIYALSTLISQQREIIADIRTLADMSGQMTMMKDMVLQPMTSALGQNLLDSYYQLRRLMIEVTKPDQTQFALQKLEEIVKDQSKFLQMQYGESSAQVDRVMSGEEIVPDGKPKKKKGKGKKSSQSSS